MLNKIVELKNGRKGKCIAEHQNGVFLLASGKGGQISSFTKEEVKHESEYIRHK